MTLSSRRLRTRISPPIGMQLCSKRRSCLLPRPCFLPPSVSASAGAGPRRQSRRRLCASMLTPFQRIDRAEPPSGLSERNKLAQHPATLALECKGYSRHCKACRARVPFGHACLRLTTNPSTTEFLWLRRVRLMFLFPFRMPCRRHLCLHLHLHAPPAPASAPALVAATVTAATSSLPTPPRAAASLPARAALSGHAAANEKPLPAPSGPAAVMPTAILIYRACCLASTNCRLTMIYLRNGAAC